MPVAALLRRLLPLLLCLPVAAQGIELPACADRPTTIIPHDLYVDQARWCVEHVIHAPHIEPYAFTALEVAPDGSLFATRPLSGEITRVFDADGDHLPDTMEPYASGLTQPNGLAWHDGALYAAGGAFVYRIDDGGVVTTLVDDLPAGSGFWTGGLAIGADERLYAAIGAPCNHCDYQDEDPQRGAILRMNLDGSQREVYASGLRHPADLEFYRGDLWTVDSAPMSMPGGVDELIRVQEGGFYGFPDCVGYEPDCENALPPTMAFGVNAAPSSLAAYPHDTHLGTEDTLLLVLRGDPSDVDIVGYKLIMLSFNETGEPLGATVIAPYVYESGRYGWLPWVGLSLVFSKYAHINERGFGFYPQQPLAVAVSAEGWIYVSMTGGRIIALRPRRRADSRQRYPAWTPMHPDYDPSADRPRDIDGIGGIDISG